MKTITLAGASATFLQETIVERISILRRESTQIERALLPEHLMTFANNLNNSLVGRREVTKARIAELRAANVIVRNSLRDASDVLDQINEKSDSIGKNFLRLPESDRKSFLTDRQHEIMNMFIDMGRDVLANHANRTLSDICALTKEQKTMMADELRSLSAVVEGI